MYSVAPIISFTPPVYDQEDASCVRPLYRACTVRFYGASASYTDYSWPSSTWLAVWRPAFVFPFLGGERGDSSRPGPDIVDPDYRKWADPAKRARERRTVVCAEKFHRK